MKKLIPLFIAAFFLTACGSVTVENPDTLTAAVISAPDSVTAKNTYNLLNNSAVSTLTAERVDVSLAKDAANYDIVYVDKSVADSPSFDAAVIENYVKNGGSVFLDNETYDLFDKDFIGAEDFVPVEGCPVNMWYSEDIDRDMKKIQGLISDFCSLYQDYTNYEETLQWQSYGVGVIPSTAQCIAERDGLGIYTLNQYGGGYVFFTNPLLPNNFSVNNLSPQDTGEPFAVTTVSANKLIRDYFEEFVSLKKYGYAVETVFGSFARPAAAWEYAVENLGDIDDGGAEIFDEECRSYGQLPSFSLVRNPYTPLYYESVTYALNKDGGFSMDAYENAYASGTHFVSDGKWLTLNNDNTYTKRAYPYPADLNKDGNMDLICGSADGGIYFFEGMGMGSNYELAAPVPFTDGEGNPVNAGAYSSPCLADIDGDGADELITGSEGGLVQCFKMNGTALSDIGVLLDTGLTDAMVSAGDLNGDRIVDIAVGSRVGELRIYYGDMGIDGAVYESYENVDAGADWCAPCIADADRDGVKELYAGVADGYIATFENNIFNGFMEGNECNSDGNNNLKFGINCVPQFYDIDGDWVPDLIAGSLEYGMAVPIDSEYFPYREELQRQLDGFKERGIYVGVHALSHEYADPFHDRRELLYHKRAFASYGIPFEGGGVSQHLWSLSKVGYDTHYDNTRGYDGTYSEEKEAGLLWNSGSKTPDSQATPGMSAESAILVPFYLDNGLLMTEPSNTPNGNSIYSYLSAKYGAPLLFFHHCGDDGAGSDGIKKADRLVTDNGYSFAGENQLMKMTAAALNTKVNAKWENDTLTLSAEPKDKDAGLYDKAYQKAAGVKVIFADGVIADEFNVDASVSYKKDNCIYASLDRGAKISKSGENNDINITEINIPASVRKNESGAAIRFREGGMMTATVKGNAKTTSKGWNVTQRDGMTTFIKYGKAETLKITK